MMPHNKDGEGDHEDKFTENPRQTLDTIISKLSKEKKSNNGIKRTRILLVSETNNACLSLSGSDEELDEGAEPDLHQCGHCKLMFNNLTKYITHKLQKTCWLDDSTTVDERKWSPEQIGSSLSEEDSSTKEEEEGEQNIKVKQINQDLQKRKQRKSLVRRLKPSETLEENESIDALQQVFDEEGSTVVIQTQPFEEAIKHLVASGNGDDKSTAVKLPVKAYTPSDSTSLHDSGSLNVQRSATTSDGKTFLQYKHGSDANGTRNKKTTSTTSFVSLQQHSKAYFSEPYYDQSNSKYDRVPSKLPNVMSTRGTSSSYDEVPSFSSSYNPSKYRQKQQPYSPEGESSSLWIGQNLPTKQKYGHYSPVYDRYRTMVAVDHNEKPSFVFSKVDGKREHETVKQDMSCTPVLEESNKVADSGTETLMEPPELVRISTVDETVVTEEATAIGTPSPPALEKCETPIYIEPKIEEETSRDSTTESVDVSNDEKAKTSHDAIDVNKFQEISSPDKETASPVDSSPSRDTEDYSQDLQTTEALEFRIPRHRQLSESTVERLITEPSNPNDASWKHAKQVYRCPLCAKIFPFKSKLQRHVLVHTGIKPYKCTVCGRGFTQQIDLQRHLTRHTGEKPFKCHLCKAQFIRADNLRKHCKDAHYVNIEEPVRKRRRKTTGSDTVLPPLEVAIALALSETERNGGRVLGRAVTRPITKPTSSTKTRQEPKQQEESNLPIHPARSEVQTFPQAGYPSSLPARADMHYPFESSMEARSTYSLSRRPASPRHQLPHRTGSSPAVPSSISSYTRRGPRLYLAHDTRLYQQSGASRYYARPGYDRDVTDMYYHENRTKRKEEIRTVPTRVADPRYHPDYRAMAMEHRNSPYSRPIEQSLRRLPAEYDYRHSSSLPKRPGDHGQSQERRLNLDYSNQLDDADVVLPRSDNSANDIYSHERHRYITSQTDSSPSRVRYQPETESPPHHSYEEYRRTREDTRKGGSPERMSRDQVDFDGYDLKNRTGPDPGEYVSMATTKTEVETISPPSQVTPLKSSAYFKSNEPHVYVDEQEIPIVTPSDAPQPP